MTEGEKLIRKLAERGIRLEVRTGQLFAHPKGRITQDEATEVMGLKDEVVAGLAWSNEKVHAACRDTLAVVGELLGAQPYRFLTEDDHEQVKKVFCRQDYGELEVLLAGRRSRARQMFLQQNAPYSHEAGRGQR